MESLAADVRFGWRQLMKRKVTTAAAILSLGLAMGSCVAAFRLMDALFLRPLSIEHPERLYVLSRQVIDQLGMLHNSDSWAYPDLVRMRNISKNNADLIAVSYTNRDDLTYKTDEEMEKAYVQYVSGSKFSSFGLTTSRDLMLCDATENAKAGPPCSSIARRGGAAPPPIHPKTKRVIWPSACENRMQPK